MSFDDDLFKRSQEEAKRQLFDSLTKKHGKLSKSVEELVSEAIDAWIELKKKEKNP